LGGKWIALLRDVEPHITRVGFMFNPSTAPFWPIYVRSATVATRSHGIEITTVTVQTGHDIEGAVAALAQGGNAGLVVLPDISTNAHREPIIAAAAKYRVPATYPTRFFAVDGGLIAYGPDVYEQFRRTATYVDRIFKGATPGDLPVQNPTKFNLVVNLRTAKAIGLTIPEPFLLTADEVIE
jgi:putative ABC transport system substrate-binding protein